MNKSVYA